MMQVMPERWSDERLDDLRDRVVAGVEHGEAELRAFRVESRTEFVALRGEMKAGFDRVSDEFAAIRKEMRDGFDRVDLEFAAVRKEMKDGFEKVDREFASVRAEMKAGFERVDARFEKVDERFGVIDSKFEAIAGKFEDLNRTLIRSCASLIIALLLYGVFLD